MYARFRNSSYEADCVSLGNHSRRPRRAGKRRWHVNHYREPASRDADGSWWDARVEAVLRVVALAVLACGLWSAEQIVERRALPAAVRCVRCAEGGP